MNNKHIISLLFLAQTIALYSQKTEVFNGEFQEGTAEYEFYTNENYDIIYNGYFHYFGEKYTANGRYKGNIPEGEWLITANNNVYSNWQSKIQTNTYVKGTYSNGLLNGVWVYNNSFSLPDWETGEFRKGDDADTDISEAHFFNNIFVGNISFNRNFQKINITGSFDNKGLMSGTWSFKKDYEEDIIKYKNGVAYWRLIRNLPTGEKSLFVDSTKFVDKFWDNYDPKSNTSIIDEKVYYAEKVQINSNERVQNSVINLTNIDIRTNRRTYDNPAIAIWQNVSVDVYQSYSATNPLYYGIRDSRSPEAYEILIKECSYSSSNDNYISNSNCSMVLNEIKQEKEIEQKNKERFFNAKKLEESIKNNISLVEKGSVETKKRLEEFKPIYSENYVKSLQYLKGQFESELNKVSFSRDYIQWTSQEENYYSILKNMETNVSNYIEFHNKIVKALDSNDKKTIKKLKENVDLSVIITNVLDNQN